MAKKKAAPKAKKPAKAAAPKGPVVKYIPEPRLTKARASTKPKNTNSNSYTFSEFVENLRAFTGLPKRTQAKELVEDVAAFIKDSLKKGYKLPLFGVGKMYVRESKARQGRNPATGEVIQIPARKRVRFTATKALKEVVLK